MPTLNERLHDLAEDAPDAHQQTDGLDPTLWARGKRLQRRRRVGAAGIAAALALGIGSLTTLVVGATDQQVAPAADSTVLGLPDRLYDPSPWTPDTGETGLLGPLVALVRAQRRTFWGDTSIGVTGVSTAGDYAFLDLPDRAEGNSPQAVALSPNGRWVAYLVTGRTTGEPNTFPGDPVVGVAVYDSASGRTTRQVVETEHGLDVDQLMWIGDTVLLDYGQYDTFTANGSSTTRSPVLTWDLATGEVDRTVSPEAYPGLADATPAGDSVVVRSGPRRFQVVAADGSTIAGPRLDVKLDGPVHVTADGGLVASYENTDPPNVKSFGNSPLVVADLRGDQAGVTRRLPDTRGDRIVGWRDNEHLIVFESFAAAASYASLDVATGEKETLLVLPERFGSDVQVAYDALTGPSFAAPEPDGPTDPRWLVGLAGAIAVLLAGALTWRHRVRP